MIQWRKITENLTESEGDLARSQETPVGDVSLEVGAGDSQEEESQNREINHESPAVSSQNLEMMNFMKIMIESLKSDLNSKLKENADVLNSNLQESSRTLRSELSENSENVRAQINNNSRNMEEKLKQNSDQVGRSLREGARDLNINLQGLRGEVSSLGGELIRVKESVNQIRAHVETQLENFQTEWNERVEQRLTGIQGELNEQVRGLSGQFEAQVQGLSGQFDSRFSRVDIQMCELQERISRVQNLEKEFENFQNKISVTVEQIGSERINTSSSLTNEAGPSRFIGNSEAQVPVARPGNSTPEHALNISHSVPEQSLRVNTGGTETNPSTNHYVESANVQVIRPPPVHGSEVSLPHFENGNGENPEFI